MAVDKNKLIIEVDTKTGKAELKGLNKELDETSKGADKAGKGMADFGTLIKGAAVVGAITAVAMALKSCVSAAAEQEVIFNRLKNQVNIIGASYEANKGRIDAFLASLQATTTYGDTDTAPILGQLTQLTGDLDAAMELTTVALDMQASGMMDAKTAALLLARAHAGDVAALGRYIPALKDANLKQLGLTTTAEKVDFAMKTLRTTFGGMAAGEIDTLTGATSQLKNEFGDFTEKVGDPFLGFLKEAITSTQRGVAGLNIFIDAVTKMSPEYITSLKNAELRVSDSQRRLDASWELYYDAKSEGDKKHYWEWIDRDTKALRDSQLNLEAAQEGARTGTQKDFDKRIEQYQEFIGVSLSMTDDSVEAQAEVLRRGADLYSDIFETSFVGPMQQAGEKGGEAYLTGFRSKLTELGPAELTLVGIDENREATEAIRAEVEIWGEEVVAVGEKYGLSYPAAERFLNVQKFMSTEAGRLVSMVGTSLASGIGRTVVEGGKLEDVFKNTVKQLKAAIVQMVIMRTLASAIGGPVGGFLPWHEGGMIYHQGGMIPKAHSGMFLPDERLILAQTGEGVLNRPAVAAIGGKPGVDALNKGRVPASPTVINVNVEAGGAFIQATDAENLEQLLEDLREVASTQIQ